MDSLDVGQGKEIAAAAAGAPLFTVFTPAYNRAHLLERPYRSLCAQACRDFEWVVVDDGSTDGTEALVRSWIGEADFPIRYFRQAHGHKKVAFNRAVREAKGELILCLDSDDELTPEGLRLFRDHWLAIPEAERSGFLGLRGGTVRPNGERTGSVFPADLIDGNWLELFYREHWNAEILACDRVDLLLGNLFPEDVSGHVPERVMQVPLTGQYKTRMFNAVVRIYHDSSDSLSGRRNPSETGVEGPALWTAHALRHELRHFRLWPAEFLRVAAHYTRYHLHMWALGKWRWYRLGGARQTLLIAALAPVGLYLFLRDRADDRRSRRNSPDRR